MRSEFAASKIFLGNSSADCEIRFGSGGKHCKNTVLSCKFDRFAYSSSSALCVRIYLHKVGAGHGRILPTVLKFHIHLLKWRESFLSAAGASRSESNEKCLPRCENFRPNRTNVSMISRGVNPAFGASKCFQLNKLRTARVQINIDDIKGSCFRESYTCRQMNTRRVPPIQIHGPCRAAHCDTVSYSVR